MAQATKAVLGTERLDAVADRGYFNGEEILACDQAGITVTLPKPMTSGPKADGRFGKQDFVYKPAEDARARKRPPTTSTCWIRSRPSGRHRGSVEPLKWRRAGRMARAGVHLGAPMGGVVVEDQWTTRLARAILSTALRKPMSSDGGAGSAAAEHLSFHCCGSRNVDAGFLRRRFAHADLRDRLGDPGVPSRDPPAAWRPRLDRKAGRPFRDRPGGCRCHLRVGRLWLGHTQERVNLV
jgi:hypothetical protein